MSRPRILLIVAAVAFLAWLSWLAVAVAQKGKSPVISRGQLTAATHLLVLEVRVGEDGLPKAEARVTRVLKGEGIAVGSTIEIGNLPSALPPGATGFPGPGEYLAPIVLDGETVRIAGLPRSPGYESSSGVRPSVYVWNAATEAQLRGLGVMP